MRFPDFFPTEPEMDAYQQYSLTQEEFLHDAAELDGGHLLDTVIIEAWEQMEQDPNVDFPIPENAMNWLSMYRDVDEDGVELGGGVEMMVAFSREGSEHYLTARVPIYQLIAEEPFEVEPFGRDAAEHFCDLVGDLIDKAEEFPMQKLDLTDIVFTEAA